MTRRKGALRSAFFLGLALLLLAPGEVRAQGVAQMLGPTVNGHLAMMLGQGTDMVDAGGPATLNGPPQNSPLPGTLPTGLGIVNSGLGNCQWTGYANAPYSEFCVGFDGAGNGLIQLDRAGGGVSPTLNVSLGGIVYPFLPGASAMLPSAKNAIFPDTNINLGLPVYNVIAYGAKCDSTGGTGTDDSVAINAAAAALRAHGFGVLYGPPDRYCYHASPLDFTNLNAAGSASNFQRSIVTLSVVCNTGSSVRCVDGIGSKYVSWDHFTLLTPNKGNCGGGDDAAIGLQIGPPNPTQTASQNNLIGTHIIGCFAKAALINFAAETTDAFGGEFDNRSITPGSHSIRIDCVNHFNSLVSFATVAWPAGTAHPCGDIDFYGVTTQKDPQGIIVKGASGNTLTFASVPAAIAAGHIARDATTATSLPVGTVVMSVTPTTVVLNNSVSSVVIGDTVELASPDPTIWMDGMEQFTFKDGYILSKSQYAVELYNEAAYPNASVTLDTHIESSPNLIADVLVGGTGAAPVIYGFTRIEHSDHSAYAMVAPDFANGVHTIEFDQTRTQTKPATQVTATFHDWGLYSNVASAVIATGGSGCTPDGVSTFTLVGGLGFPITQVSGTVTGGVLANPLTVPTPGSYLITPGTTVATTGGSCAVQPTITPTYGGAVSPITATGMTIANTNANFSPPSGVNGLIAMHGAGSQGATQILGSRIQLPNIPNAAGAGQGSVCVDTSNYIGFCTVSPRLVRTGAASFDPTGAFTAQTPVTTEFYFAEVFIPDGMTVTGVAVFNSGTISGNMKVGLFDSTGAFLATSASTGMSGTSVYQRVPFTAPYVATGPGTYYIGVFYDNNTVRPNTFTAGNFGVGKSTGQDYATGFTTITPPTTFTTALAPVASLY